MIYATVENAIKEKQSNGLFEVAKVNKCYEAFHQSNLFYLFISRNQHKLSWLNQ